MKTKQPKIGDEIYVPSSYHVYRGADDFEGGLANIDRVVPSDHLPKNHENYMMVGIKQNPSTLYNYKILLEKQEKLKKEYKGKVAHPNPDLSPEFNQPFADWQGHTKT